MISPREQHNGPKSIFPRHSNDNFLSILLLAEDSINMGAQEEDHTADVNPEKQHHNGTQRTKNKLVAGKTAGKIPFKQRGCPPPENSDKYRDPQDHFPRAFLRGNPAVQAEEKHEGGEPVNKYRCCPPQVVAQRTRNLKHLWQTPHQDRKNRGGKHEQKEGNDQQNDHYQTK